MLYYSAGKNFIVARSYWIGTGLRFNQVRFNFSIDYYFNEMSEHYPQSFNNLEFNSLTGVAMKKFQKSFIFIVLLVIVGMVSGCASAPDRTRVTVSDYQPPEWVNKGSGAFKDGSGEKVFYGVGSADGIRSISLRRSAADDRALASLAAQIEANIKRLSKDFQEITGRSTEAGKDSTERENVAQAFKVLVNQTLSGSKIIDHWEHPAKNVLYSLARIELKIMEKKIDSHHELSDESKDLIKKRAEKLHEEMRKEGL